jgi:hypothetical protein
MAAKKQKKALSTRFALILILLPITLIAALTVVSFVPRAFVPDPGPVLIFPTLASGPTATVSPTPGLWPTATRTITPTPPVAYVTPFSILIKNNGFEIDTNHDLKPDFWSTQSYFTVSNEKKLSGSYSGRHYATNDATYTITQSVQNIVAGKQYLFNGYVFIPATSDKFTFTLQLRWRTSADTDIRTDTVQTFTLSTPDWTQVFLRSVYAPTGASKVQVLMRVSSLKGKIFVDDFQLSSY